MTVWPTETPQCRSDNTPNFSHEMSLFIATLKRQIQLVKGDPYGNIFAFSFKVTAHSHFSRSLFLSLSLSIYLYPSLSLKGVLSRSLRNSPRRTNPEDSMRRYLHFTSSLSKEQRQQIWLQRVERCDRESIWVTSQGELSLAQDENSGASRWREKNWLAGRKSAG